MGHLFFTLLDYKLQDSQQNLILKKNQHFSLEKNNQEMVNQLLQEGTM